MDKQQHFFFAVKLPDETKFMMQKHIETLKQNLPFKRWVHYQDLHITLAFLGAAPAELLMKARHNVSEVLPGTKPFNLSIHQLGTFGKLESPRIFFADTMQSNELQLVREKVFTACEAAGFKLETRPFRPHITLARKWAGNEPFQQKLLAAWAEIQPEPLNFETTEVALYQTHLDKTPKYEVVQIFNLLTF